MAFSTFCKVVAHGECCLTICHLGKLSIIIFVCGEWMALGNV